GGVDEHAVEVAEDAFYAHASASRVWALRGSTRAARRAMPVTATTTSPSPIASDDAAVETKPITGGPLRNPSQPMLDTAATPADGAAGEARPAARKVIGTMVERPAPRTAQPRTAVTGVCVISAAVSPAAPSVAPARTRVRAPKRSTRPSPASRPDAIAPEKA